MAHRVVMPPTLEDLRARADVIVVRGSRAAKPGSWRHHAQSVLAEAHQEKGDVLTRAEIREIYPFGDRKYWPYKQWLHAVKDYYTRWGDPDECDNCGYRGNRCHCT